MNSTSKGDELSQDIDFDTDTDFKLPKFKITGALAACGVFDGCADIPESARLLHEAGFACIPLGAIAVQKIMYGRVDDAQVFAGAVGGQVVAVRYDRAAGEYDCRITVPLGKEGRDRSKLPFKGWQTMPFSEDWWIRGRAIRHNGRAFYGDARRNVGVRTGNGLVVIDVDRKDGRDGLEALRATFGDAYFEMFPATFTVTTPTGGEHWYYECDEDVRNSAGKLACGVDVRGTGGFVVGPGSVRLNGRGYEITNLRPLARLPAVTLATLRALTPSSPPSSPLDDDDPWLGEGGGPAKDEVLAAAIERYPEPATGWSGIRHQTLISVAGFARNRLASDDDLEWVIRGFADANGLAQKDAEDLEGIIQSAKQMKRNA
jgi:hypothetical protein